MARRYVVGVALIVACQCALAQAIYRIKSVGSLPGGCTSYPPTAAGFNEADQVSGNVCNSQGHIHAFVWKNDGAPMVDLGPPEAESESYAVGINASGLVAGYGADSTGYFAFVSSGHPSSMTRTYSGHGAGFIVARAFNNFGQVTGTVYPADNTASKSYLWNSAGSTRVLMGTLGGTDSIGVTINASGQVAGSSLIAGNVATHAFVWRNDGSPMSDLGTLGGISSDAAFINDLGQIAGVSDVSGNAGSHAFFWRNDGTPMQDLGTLGGTFSFVYSLNDAGQVAGFSGIPRNQAARHAFVWMNDGTPMKDLGTFGGTWSVATDINSSGQVTGSANRTGNKVSHAFLWRNDGTRIRDLNKLVDPTDPLKAYIALTTGRFINNSGDILAYGVDSRTGLQGLYVLQGTLVTLSPRSVTFGTQPLHIASAAKSVTVTNTSSKVVAITSIALTGTAAGQFASTNNCGSSLAGNATCTIKVTFKPTTKGAKSAVLNVNGGGGGLRSVNLTGTGT